MPMIPTFEMLSCRRQTIGPQCTAHDFVMTSSATEIVRALEQSWTQIDQLRAELAEYRRGAERYRTALEQIVAPFEDLNFVSGNKLLTYIHDTATAALAAKGA